MLFSELSAQIKEAKGGYAVQMVVEGNEGYLFRRSRDSVTTSYDVISKAVINNQGKQTYPSLEEFHNPFIECYRFYGEWVINDRCMNFDKSIKDAFLKFKEVNKE